MKPSFMMIHHTAVSYDKNSDQFVANNNYHKTQWNLKSSLGFYLGYNYEIAKNGKVYQARKDGEETAACYQENMNDGRAIHIALDGNFDAEEMTPAQTFALRDLLKKLVLEYGIKRENIVPHNKYALKTCPGSKVDMEFIRSLAFPNVVANKPTEEDLKTQIIKTLKILSDLINKL